jgi:hypothetical protein
MKYLKGWGEDDVKELLKIFKKSIKKSVKKSIKKSVKKSIKKSVKKSGKKSIKKVKKSVKKSLKKAIKKSNKQKGKGVDKKMISEPFIIKPIWQEEEEEMKKLSVEETYLPNAVASKIKYTYKIPQKSDIVNVAEMSYLENDGEPIKTKKLEKPSMQMALLDL